MNKCCCGCGENASTGKTYRRGHWSRTTDARAMYDARRSSGDGPNPSGICLCGCGQPTKIAPYTSPRKGWIVGQPKRFLHGHAGRLVTGAAASNWKGGRTQRSDGYIYVAVPGHPAASKDGYVLEHRHVVEQAIGRFLERHEKVHHLNHIKTDNRLENLQVFSNHADHMKHHGTDGLRRYHAEHPNARRDAGRKGAESRWGKRSV